MFIIGNGLKESAKVKDAQGFNKTLGKVVVPGTKYRLFFRICKNAEGDLDLVMAAVPGRTCDYDITGTGFITFEKDEIDIDEYGKLKDKTGLQDWSRISSVIHRARCIREKKNKELEMTTIAQEQETEIDRVELSKALDGIEEKYFGGKSANGDRILAKVSPCISGLQVKLIAQCLLVPLAADTNPEWDKAEIVSLDISNKRKTQIETVFNNPDYRNMEDGFIEIAYDYIGKDKQEAGQNAAFTGVSKDLSLKTKYPETWEKYAKDFLQRLGANAEEIAIHNKKLQRYATPADIVSNVKKYCATNVGIMTAIDLNDEMTKNVAKLIIDNDLVKGAPKVHKALCDIIAEQEAEAAEAATDGVSSEEDAAAKAEAEEAAATEEMILGVANEVLNNPVNTLSEAMNAVGSVDIDELTGGVEDL